MGVLRTKKKLRIGYHWPKTEGQKGGIARYIRCILENVDESDFECVNFSDLRILSGSFIRKVIFLLDLFCPVFNIRHQKIDVYWGVAHKLPLFRIKGVKYVVTIHDLVWKRCPDTMPLLRRLAERFFFPFAVQNADVILAVSQSTADDIIRYFPSHAAKVKVSPLAGMLEDQKNISVSFSSDQKYILFVGTIEPRKNIEKMLTAYADLPLNLKKKYTLCIVGSTGWGKIKLDDIAAELGISSYVEWKSAVNDQELVRLYKNGYCLLFPSLYEGFGLPIIEAQNFGVPVITSNTSSMPEVVGDGGILVDPNSVSSIKNALRSLLENVELRDSLSQKARNNSLRFSWARTCQSTCEAFYESLNLRDT
tara:strand:+ start:973 stop:2067 length:1095 start_codon:yes stop_codon:yes gene_type:complete